MGVEAELRAVSVPWEWRAEQMVLMTAVVEHLRRAAVGTGASRVAVLEAECGTGKTLAICYAVLHELSGRDFKNADARENLIVIAAPTHAINVQQVLFFSRRALRIYYSPSASLS